VYEGRGRVLVVAGSDSSGGAGLQADIKTLTALGAYAATAVTAITVQDTRGVRAVVAVAADVVLAQGLAVLDDIGADALKLGMLGGVEVMRAAAELIDRAGDAPAVIDPVMTAKGGASLMPAQALGALKAELIPRAAVLTPNAPEAAALTGLTVETPDDLRRAGEALLRAGARAVLVKGGHLDGTRVVDVLVTAAGETRFESDRIVSRHTHGTGCTLASALAAGLARGETLEAAVAAARAYVLGAIAHAPGFGAGHGPLDHGWRLRSPQP
jgi:hydroxymethylpyrimidine/phosphomethylpyrimidine kinase